MICSIGLDIVEIARIRKDLDRFGDRFVSRILGQKEQAALSQRQDREAFLAGRLAAKEAIIKGLGVFIQQRPPFNSIEIINDSTGAPVVNLPADIMPKLGGARCFLSLTHERHYAAAVAVFAED